jgi:hypothetical protein
MTKSVTYNDFSIGKDKRKNPSVSEANRLLELKNAFVTTGKSLRKRPGSVKITDLETGTKGLFAANGKLNTFYEDGSITHSHSLCIANLVDHGSVATPVKTTHSADVVDGFPYVVIEYDNGDIKHHYLDGSSPTRITDTNCPNTKSMVKLAEKVFAVGSANQGVVRYSATANPRDWTTASDAGFIATNRFQQGNEDPEALGEFKKSLVVFHVNGAQLWTVDPDPKLFVRQQGIPGASTRYHGSIAPLSSDLFFLSDSGIRSISELQLTESLSDFDVGSPIDSDVKALLPPTEEPISLFYHKAGEFWCAIGSTVFMFKLSKAAQISAWSEYSYPFNIDAMTELDGDLYLRSGDTVYRVDEDVHTDDGTPIDSVIQLPYTDTKKPGVNKQYTGMDAVVSGTVQISFQYDPNDPTLETEAQEMTGDTRVGGLTPIEVGTTNISPLVHHTADEDFELAALQLYYETLGIG